MNLDSERAPATPAEYRRKRRMFDRSSMIAAVLIGLFSVVLGFLAARYNPLLFGAVSTEGARIDGLFSLMLGVGTTFFFIVEGTLLYSIIRFRRGPGNEGEGLPVRGNLGLELLWTAIPAGLVTAIAIFSYQILIDIEQSDPSDMTVELVARQFSWEFYYPDHDITTGELHAQVGQTVHLKMRSADVIHAFWVPEFRIKKDIVPNRITETWITPTQVGEFPVVCAELCGAGHAVMRTAVVVHEPDDFQTWLAEAAAAGAQAPVDDPLAYGRQLFQQYGCQACHALADANAAGQVGPNLDHIGTLAGEMVAGQSAEEYLHTAIIEPDEHIVEGYPPDLMPDDYEERMSDEELEAMVQYLMLQE